MFEKATKKKSKLKLALYGAAGSGKTYTALEIASGLGKRVAVIDTEHGSAAKYADLFKFDVCELPSKTIDSYIKAIEFASNKFDVLIIDSLTHGWQALCEEVEKLAQTKYRGNTWSAWSQGTPKQRRLIDAIVSSKCHIIATMRAKTEWTTSTNERGKSAPSRVGLAPEQGKGIEYEFDFLASITPEHVLTFEKSRAKNFQDRIIERPDKNTGIELAAWLDDGESIEMISDEQLIKLQTLIKETNYQAKRDLKSLTKKDAEQFIKLLKDKKTNVKEEVTT